MLMLERLKFVYRGYRYRYRLDPREIKYIQEQLNQGEIAADIGAHKGGYLYWLSKQVGSTGKIYAFEPQPNLFSYLKKMQQFALPANVTLENLGLSSTEGVLDFYIPEQGGLSSPGATFNAQKIKEEDCRVIQVKTTTLDTYFTDKTPPSLLKIDVEGHELEVFEGAKQLLATKRPKILVECEQRHLSFPIEKVFEFLLDLNYKGHFVHRNSLKPLSSFSLTEHQAQTGPDFWKRPDYCNNFIFE